MLIFYIHYINFLFAVAGLLLLVLTGILFADYLYNQGKIYKRFLLPYVWFLITITTAGGVATTLLYSEYFGFVPCSLCWLQRIALYPQVFMSLVAWRLDDVKNFPWYGIGLSAFGFIVAVYQYIYQLVPTEVRTELMPCLADGTADCGTKVMEVFGFVTFPFLSAVLFLFLMILYLNLRRI